MTFPWSAISPYFAVIPSFDAEAVTFDGSDYLTRAGVGCSSSNLLFSTWLYVGSAIDADYGIVLNVRNSGTRIVRFQKDPGGYFRFELGNGGGVGNILVVYNNTKLFSTDEWHHLLFARTGSTFQIYLDDAENAQAASTNTGGDWLYSGNQWAVGARYDGALPWNGDLAETYFTDEYLDISIEANRRKFITATGTPVDLGSDGSTPTGTQPRIYMSGDASVWNAGTNKGSGGNFTMNGSVVDSSNEPVAVPSYDAVFFDGHYDYLLRGPLTGASDGTVLTTSFWARFTFSGLAAAQDPLFVGQLTVQQAGFVVDLNTTNGNLVFIGRNAAKDPILELNAQSQIVANEWTHVLFSVDLSDTGSPLSKLHLYFNDVEVTSPNLTVFENDDFAISSGNVNIARWASSLGHYRLFQGDLAELYFTNEYVDFSIEANRRKFITATGTPEDLGSDGSTPTGTQPLIYLTGNASVWNTGTNQGSGGDFTMNSGVTNSTHLPVEAGT